MKNKNIIISMFFIVMLTITSNMFSITSSAGVSDNLFQNDLTNLQNQIDELNNKMYPIGFVYISFNDTNPGDIIGGTWEKLESGRMLMSGDVAGQTGGNNSVRLESSQIPSLSVSGTTDSAGDGMTATSSVSSYTYSSRTGSTSTNGNHSHNAGYNPNTVTHYYAGDEGYEYGKLQTSRYSVTTSENGNHSHTVYYNDYYANGIKTTVSGLTPHTHTFTSNYINNSQQSIDITNPYITVFMWKRIK